MNKTIELFSEPNKYARPAASEIHDTYVVFHGYQEYILSKQALQILPIDNALKIKKRILSRYFSSQFVGKKTILDLGGNGGFFSFWALQNGAEKATLVEMDDVYIDMVKKARSTLEFNLEVYKANVIDWETPANVVVALALIHWIYSCTAILGSLEAVIKKLASLTDYMLIVEWIAPEDPAIEFFHHIEKNKEFIQAPYTFDAFIKALEENFVKYERIGEISPTRILFVAFKKANIIDYSGQLPFILPKELVISRRLLTRTDGIDYWSCVYDDSAFIYKQATLDLAKRESDFLEKLEGPYFPRVIDVKVADGYSVVILEKIEGISLLQAAQFINATLQSFYTFICHCLKILELLRDKKIFHRDIQPDNLLVRNEWPVLLDFGWAISKDMPFITPVELGGPERSSDGSFSDVYSMGRVLEQINQHKFPVINQVIALMIQTDPLLRVEDLNTLALLFNLIAERALPEEHRQNDKQGTHGNDTFKNFASYKLALQQLLEQISQRNQQLSMVKAELDRQVQAKDKSVQALSAQLNEITISKAWRVVMLLRRIRVLLISPDSWVGRVIKRLIIRT